ncbi:SGNH/GDSL hydrolase family protein [Nocardia alba]|uniref:Lysophospholipase L1-like esterase n=1 Tax=Nocardia alba TaxID=225051 RepID=A0A4R1F721_9NOCA|nr:SGNH/GDSL hydrolase family protein [Nocardia alba]TCJ89783.1 lysophospholipase L1-like esterase [Nocardia alba]
MYSSKIGRALRTGTTAAACVAATVLPCSTSQAEPVSGTPQTYVALGDSFSAGVGISPLAPVSGLPSVCGRSSVNYPHLLAEQLGVATFRDVTCGSATSADLAGRQSDLVGSREPQFDALSPDTTLVTLGIGGNDIGLIELGAGCVNPLPEPVGSSCADRFTVDGHDRIGARIEAFAPTYGLIIDQIRARSPQARIVMVGYPVGIRLDGCPGVQPTWAADANYLQSKIDQLNTVMAAQAAVNNVDFVGLAASTAGHDACAEPGQNWITGIVPQSIESPVPMHPNAAGHRNAAQQLLTTLTR